MKTKRAKQTRLDHDKLEEQEHEKKIDNIVKKKGKKRRKMKKVGIDYNFPGYVSLVTFYLTLKAVYQLTFFTEKRKKIGLFCCFFLVPLVLTPRPPPLLFSGCGSENKTC